MTNAVALSAVAEVVVSEVAAVTPAGVALPVTVDEWLIEADKRAGSTYDAVRNAAMLAVHDTVEFEAGTVITADMRAKAIFKGHKATFDSLTNKANIGNWFRNFLVVQFAKPDAMLEIAPPTEKQGAVSVPAASAINLSKDQLSKAAQAVRALEGTSGNNAGKDLGAGKSETAAGATVDQSGKQPAEVAAEVVMWERFDAMMASLDGAQRIREHLAVLGWVLVTKPDDVPEDTKAIIEAEAEADKAEAKAKRGSRK
jgi:hypothetical protein